MAEPFEFISRGMDLVAQGKFTDAEKYIQRGIKESKQQKDTDGVTYALGRLGDCYEEADEKPVGLRFMRLSPFARIL